MEIASGPDVSLYFQCNAAILATDAGSGFVQWAGGVRVAMGVLNVTNGSVYPATGTTDKALAYFAYDDLSHSFCIELSPTFIKYHPLDNTRMVSESCDNSFRFIFKVLFGIVFVSGR